MTTERMLVTFLLDRSGSMSGCKAATIEAFNAYLGELKAPDTVAVDFTFLQFDSQSLDKICVAEPVANVKELTDATYLPRGGTPLIDASVKTINAVAASLAKRDDKPKVVVCIQTDGQENESREHTWAELRELITAKQAEGWQFNFMGAGIDAYDSGQKMGISAMATMSYNQADAGATKSAFVASASLSKSFGAGRSVNTEYSNAMRGAAGDQHFTRYIDPQATALDLGAGATAKADTVRGGFKL